MRWSPPRSLAVALAGLTLGALPWTAPAPVHGQDPPPPAAPAPDADLAKRVQKLGSAINQRLDASQIAEAVPPAREKLDLLARTLGKDHWQTGDARRSLETCQRLAGLPREVQDRYAKSRQADARANQLYARGQYAEAALLFRETLTIRRDTLGEDHPDTTASYNNLAWTLDAQGKYAEAEAMHRRALAIRLKAPGEDHPNTALSYNNLAATLRAQGKYAEAEAMFRRALAIRLKALGEGHPDTALSYNNLAATLRDQGKSAEAEAMHRRALAIQLKALGEDHPNTAFSYANLAETLRAQGKYAEAEAMQRRALAIRLKAQGADHPHTAQSYNNLAATLRAQGKSAEAEAMHRRALAIMLKALGADHPHTAASYNNLALTLHDQGKSAEAEAMFRRALAIYLKALGADHPETAATYNNLAATLRAQGKSAEAEAMHRRALAIRLKALGADHPHTAQSYDNLAGTLDDQGKYGEAEAIHRRALAIDLKALGEDHAATATSYNNLAATLRAQGKYAEAEAMFRRALAIRLKAQGEDHPATATTYNNLALTLYDQGKYTEAEAMHRRALAIRLKALGEGHPHTATSYDNLALTLRAQGKYAEAEAMHRRALAIKLKALGADHPDTALSYNNLALTLDFQGKYGEAEAMHRRALAIQLKALGEDHPNTASSYANLAETLRAQGKYAEAEAMHRRALAIRLKAQGADHPHTALSYNGLALTLRDQGKYAEAEAMHRHALAIMLKALGADHPDTANSCANLAWFLDRQGKHDDALRTWTSAAASYEQARLRGAKGLDAALTAGNSPLPSFALALARAGQPRDAWTRWEQGLARGLADEVTGRAARPLTAAEHDREASLLGQAQALDERIGKLLALKALSQEQEKLLEDLERQGSELRRQVLELEQQFESKYGGLAGQPATLEAAQKALPEGTALVGWIDQDPYHWACLLRHSGDPVWVRLPGSGKDGDWSKEEEGRTQRLRAELDPQTTRRNARPLAEALARQRLEPLKEHLQGVNRLVVVNSPGLAGVPIEVLMAARPDPAWAGLTVAYAPSASMFAHLVVKPTPRDRAPTLLALADPAYPEIKRDTPAPTPPAAGLAIARVVPNGNADLNGIQAGDILLSYAGTVLNQHADLKTVAPDAGPKKVPVRYWREGITREVEVATGPLGVMIDDRPAKAAMLARQAAERVLLGMRGGSHQRLPGTRREVEAVARLFPAGMVTTVMGEQACESTVQDLARSGRMKAFRYLHFATHGESDPRNAYRSALILAPDPDRAADPLAFDSDGTITAEQIARTWELDADLVLLSACESGLGRAAGGEGYLGFAQPLFAKGARSLVLSLWKVDDDATALLMTRFYQDLLGTRAGLKSPLRKAEALAESKAWLRGAGPEEVGEALAALPRGSIVRREAVASQPAARPYEDPTYWAGFILIGSPD